MKCIISHKKLMSGGEDKRSRIQDVLEFELCRLHNVVAVHAPHLRLVSVRFPKVDHGLISVLVVMQVHTKPASSHINHQAQTKRSSDDLS